MSQRTRVTGTRATALWFLVLIAVALIVGIFVSVLIFYPNYINRQAVSQHYAAGVAFQTADDLDAAAKAYREAIAIDANYEDVQARYAEVQSKLSDHKATATVAAATQVAQATAVVMSRATETAKTAEATATAAPLSTLQALESQYEKGVGYMNLNRWEDAKSELEIVFEVDPNYQDIQDRLATVSDELEKLTLTATQISSVQPTATPSPVSIVIEIPSWSKWVATGVELTRGERFMIEYVSGYWVAGPEPNWDMVGPEGYPQDDSRVNPTSIFTLRTGRLMALVGKLGDGPAFLVGREYSSQSTSSGMLWLGANDDKFDDNREALTIRMGASKS